MKHKAIITKSNRRNAENNPEFLDTEALLCRFEPLLKSIYRRFVSYYKLFDENQDKLDLYNQILFEFLKLRQEFDPKRGVDFPGYIKFHLQQRVYHHVMKYQKVLTHELPIKSYVSESDSSLTEYGLLDKLLDEKASEEFEEVIATSSVPWDELDPEQFQFITSLIEDKKSIEEIAQDKNVSVRSIKKLLDDTCQRLIEIHNSHKNN